MGLAVRYADRRLRVMRADAGGNRSGACDVGPSIVGFGTHRYEYEPGRKGETAAVGFLPRKQALAVYGLDTTDEAAIARLGKLTKAKGYPYFSKLSERLSGKFWLLVS